MIPRAIDTATQYFPPFWQSQKTTWPCSEFMDPQNRLAVRLLTSGLAPIRADPLGRPSFTRLGLSARRPRILVAKSLHGTSFKCAEEKGQIGDADDLPLSAFTK
jgi:hypothetical protein